MYVKPVYQKAESIRFIYECVLNVVLDYNKIISSLSDDERLLFRPLISAVEKKISPGLNKLTWGTDIGDEYIADCSNTTAEVSFDMLLNVIVMMRIYYILQIQSRISSRDSFE